MSKLFGKFVAFRLANLWHFVWHFCDSLEGFTRVRGVKTGNFTYFFSLPIPVTLQSIR